MPCGALAGDELEVRGVAADHAAEADDGVDAARRGQRLGRERQLERAGHPGLGDVVVGDAAAARPRRAPVEQPVA